MKLFVTGGTGFIGSHFLNAAHAAGHEVVALRRSPASQPRIPLVRDPLWIDQEMTAVKEPDLAGTDVLVHLAAHSVNAPYDTLGNCIQANLLAPLTLFERAIDAEVQRFVVAGSCFEYGKAGERYDFIPPDAPLEPTQTYAASKAAASVAFYQFGVEKNVSFSIHRIFHVFGEGESEGRLWPSLRRAALAGENLEMTPAEQVRDFVPVELVAQRLLAAAGETPEPGFPQISNLGTGQPQTVRAFAEHWWTRWQATGQLKFGAKPYRDGEVMRYVPG